MKIGLVIARDEKDLSELKKFASEAKGVDLLLFPEGYLDVSQLTEAGKIVAESGKWLITSYSDKRGREKHEVGVVFNRKGKIVGQHAKTTPTSNEIKKGYVPGKSIKVIETKFGKIGICVCFEMHFPEIAREYKLQGARVVFNPIGTGMYHEEQFKLWTSLGKTRAYENTIYTLGCSHFTGAIPIAYAYDKDGAEILKKRSSNKIFKVNIPIEKMTREDDKCSFVKRRTPRLYKSLSK